MSEPQDPNEQQPASEQPASEQPAPEQPAAEQPTAPEQPSGESQPAAEPLSFDKQPSQSPEGGQQYGTPPPGSQYGPPPGPQYGPPPGQQYGSPPPGQQFAPPPGQPYGGYPAAPAYSQPPPRDPQGRIFDPASGLYLPPGVELASHGRRIGAYFLAIPLAIVTLVIGYVIWGLIVWARGTTPALQVLGMKCYRVDNGEVPTWWRMVLREVVGGIATGVLGFITELTSFILFLTTGKRQALHDLIATTTVVYDPNKVLS
ncbi:MAG TPA: RDD family protein [Jatrophihabitantaceae bacterium]